MYGIESKQDLENAGDVIKRWARSEPSKPPTSQKSYVATNVQALRAGNLTGEQSDEGLYPFGESARLNLSQAKSQREFGLRHPVMKTNPKRDAEALQKQRRKNAEIGVEPITSIYQKVSAAKFPRDAIGRLDEFGLTLQHWKCPHRAAVSSPTEPSAYSPRKTSTR